MGEAGEPGVRVETGEHIVAGTARSKAAQRKKEEGPDVVEDKLAHEMVAGKWDRSKVLR